MHQFLLFQKSKKYLKIRALPLSVALAAIFASTSMANIVGSTYTGNTSTTGNTQISGFSGTFTDPANPGFCVGPPVACGSGSGVSGSFTFGQVSPTMDTITFAYFGSTAGAGPGSFSIDLGNFVTLDGETVTGVTYASGSLGGATSTGSFGGGAATFTYSTGSDYNAIGGNFVTFDVTTTAATPEPASVAWLLTAIGLVVGRKRLGRRNPPVELSPPTA